MDGDGLDEILVGAPCRWAATECGGTGAVLLETPVGEVGLTDAEVVFEGHDDTNVGVSMAGVGDIDGDGNDDIVVGDDRWLIDGQEVGAAFLFRGWVTPGLRLVDADARILGTEERFKVGRRVAAGLDDLNRDGFDDVLIGAPGDFNPNISTAGDAFLFHGGPHLFSRRDRPPAHPGSR